MSYAIQANAAALFSALETLQGLLGSNASAAALLGLGLAAALGRFRRMGR